MSIVILFTACAEDYTDTVETTDVIVFATVDVQKTIIPDAQGDDFSYVEYNPTCDGFTENTMYTCILYHGDSDPPQCVEALHPDGCRRLHCEVTDDVCWMHPVDDTCTGVVVAAPPANFDQKWDEVPQCD